MFLIRHRELGKTKFRISTYCTCKYVRLKRLPTTQQANTHRWIKPFPRHLHAYVQTVAINVIQA